MTLRVVIAEDSLLLREGLVRLFGEAGLDVVAAHADGRALIEDLPRTLPDVAVLDVRMPPTFRDEGVVAAVHIRTDHPAVGVLLLSQYAEAAYATRLVDSGAGRVGYLLKDRVSSVEALSEAVRRIAEGGTVLDEEVVRELFARRRDPLAALTPRERDVLRLMAEGRTNLAIAASLHLAVGSVEKHTTAIFGKLRLDDSGTDHRRVLAVLTWLRAATAS